MSIEEVEKIVQLLEDFGYYKYANPTNLEVLKKDLSKIVLQTHEQSATTTTSFERLRPGHL